MSQRPDVSVIVAAFNAEQHIGRALASALAQTDVSVEVIVADDASTDRTVAKVKEVADERLRLIKLPTNGGPGAARNAAIELARADWIAVLDADDAMMPGRVAKLLATARGASADIVADNLVVDVAGDRALLIEETLDDGCDRIDFVAYVLNNRPTKRGLGYGYLKPVFRTAFLKTHGLAYDPRLRIGEDFMLVAEMLVRGAVYVRQRSAGYIYSKHSGSTSHRLGDRAADAMADADARFLADHEARLSPAGRAAMNAHARSARDAAAFARFLEALKGRHLRAAVMEAAQRPAVLALMQAPIKARLARLV